MSYRTGPSVEDQMGNFELNERKLIFAMRDGRHIPLTKAAERALTHYGFISPLDTPSYHAFEGIMAGNWPSVDIEWYQDELEPFNHEWSRLIQDEYDRAEYEMELRGDARREEGGF